MGEQIDNPAESGNMRDMKRVRFASVTHAEVVDGGVVLTFDGGKSSFLSASLLHEAVCRADELPEFSGAEREALTSQSARPRPIFPYSAVSAFCEAA